MVKKNSLQAKINNLEESKSYLMHCVDEKSLQIEALLKTVISLEKENQSLKKCGEVYLIKRIDKATKIIKNVAVMSERIKALEFIDENTNDLVEYAFEKLLFNPPKLEDLFDDSGAAPLCEAGLKALGFIK